MNRQGSFLWFLPGLHCTADSQQADTIEYEADTDQYSDQCSGAERPAGQEDYCQYDGEHAVEHHPDPTAERPKIKGKTDAGETGQQKIDYQ